MSDSTMIDSDESSLVPLVLSPELVPSQPVPFLSRNSSLSRKSVAIKLSSSVYDPEAPGQSATVDDADLPLEKNKRLPPIPRTPFPLTWRQQSDKDVKDDKELEDEDEDTCDDGGEDDKEFFHYFFPRQQTMSPDPRSPIPLPSHQQQYQLHNKRLFGKREAPEQTLFERRAQLHQSGKRTISYPSKKVSAPRRAASTSPPRAIHRHLPIPRTPSASHPPLRDTDRARTPTTGGSPNDSYRPLYRCGPSYSNFSSQFLLTPKSAANGTTVAHSAYVTMLFNFATVPRLHDFAAALAGLTLLLAFVLIPVAFAGRSSAPTVIALSATFLVLGAVGFIVLGFRWRRNAMWVLSRVYMPGTLYSLAGAVGTLASAFSISASEPWTSPAARAIFAVEIVGLVGFGAGAAESARCLLRLRNEHDEMQKVYAIRRGYRRQGGEDDEGSASPCRGQFGGRGCCAGNIL